METYALRTLQDSNDFVTILKETDDGYIIRIVRDKDGYDEVTKEFLSKEMFESCIRTGYLTKVESKVEDLVATA